MSLLGIAGAAILVYAIDGGEDFHRPRHDAKSDRRRPRRHLHGPAARATRRTTGWIVPVVAMAFLAYSYFGPYLPQPWTHRGFDIGQIVGQLFITLEGIFGVPVDVSSSLIILFCIYGAFLQHSGAGKILHRLFARADGQQGKQRRTHRRALVVPARGSVGLGRRHHGDDRRGRVSDDGQGRLREERRGGLLAAGGLGAIISPPVLGAAAFLIAEFLKISYLDVIWMALIPTCLYYLSLLFMVELDAKRFGARMVSVKPELTLWQMMRRHGFPLRVTGLDHLFMLWGYSPTLSVFWSTVLTFALSFLTRETALTPKKLVRALSDGSTSALTAATTCATAGIIVGVVTLTGLGLKFSSIVIDYAGGSLLLTTLYTALIVWIVGLAVPVTASYIICAVIAAPGDDQARCARHRGAHVHLLLLGALRGVAADRAVALRGRRHHRRRSLQDDLAGVEIHAARIPRAVRVRARPAGRRAAVDHCRRAAPGSISCRLP
jgi:TRAP-type uncharacterized transport system fused permease subunit